MNINWVGIILDAVWTDLRILAAMVVEHPWPFAGVVGLLILVVLIPSSRSRRRRRYR
jgi:hypothetical protein